MPKNSGDVPMIQWPLFLLSSKVIQLHFDNCRYNVKAFFECLIKCIEFVRFLCLC